MPTVKFISYKRNQNTALMHSVGAQCSFNQRGPYSLTDAFTSCAKSVTILISGRRYSRKEGIQM